LLFVGIKIDFFKAKHVQEEERIHAALFSLFIGKTFALCCDNERGGRKKAF
jgi:hypothetical protein